VNVAELTTNGDYEVTFHLKRPQPSFLALLATGWSPIYPCHVSRRDMRSHPIGTGPFKFVEFQPTQAWAAQYLRPFCRSLILGPPQLLLVRPSHKI